MNLDRLILFLQNINGIGDSAIRKLIICNCFNNFHPKNLEDVLEFIKKHSIYFSKKSAIESLSMDDLKKANEIRKQIEEKCESLGIKYISYFSDEYPIRFKKMKDTKKYDFPLILFYKGDLNLLNSEKTCAILGTRKPSEKAILIGQKITKKMTESGYVIISGLAEGCDTIGHRECLNAGGKTVAIVGTGLDTVFPKSNTDLLDEILQKDGLVISEYPVGFKGATYSFVQRDRLQAACSDILIPIQTSIHGGTMHAARAGINIYHNKVLVVSPKLVDDGDMSGNAFLIKEYFAKEIVSLDEFNL